jgi:hypothetical protein
MTRTNVEKCITIISIGSTSMKFGFLKYEEKIELFEFKIIKNFYL